MASLLRHFAAIVAVLIVAGCSGGGCGGGCSSCGGLTPLANGFDPSQRIENAGSARITHSGLQFLQQNLGTLAKGLIGGMSNGGVLTFDVPESGGGSFPAEYDVCPGGPSPGKCQAEIDTGNANLTITPTSPYDLSIKGTMPIRLKDLPINFKIFGIPGSADATLTDNKGCPGGTENFDNFPLDVDIAIHVNQNMMQTANYGYSKVEIKHIVNDTDAQNDLKNHLYFCGGIGASILNLVEPLIIGQLYNGLVGTLTDTISQQLCQKPAPTCPTGTNDVNGICRYGTTSSAECASIILGTDGHMDLGGLLASLSPGVHGGLDFLFAAGGPSKSDHDPTNTLSWGDLDGTPYGSNGGVTLGLFGGAEPNPLSKCVKLSQIALPTGIPIPNELYGETIPNWPSTIPGPHVGIAVSERFANYALNGVYNSGLLCLGISTETIPLLSSSTLGLLAPSAKDLGIQHESQQVAIVIRPSSAPTITFGNGTDLAMDPNLRVKLNQVSLDFYMFSLDRFIRFMTATFDLDVPVNLTVSSAGLTPVLNKIGVTNGKVTNNSLLREKPDTLASSLGDLIGSLVGQQLAGSLKAIDFNKSLSSLGLELIIPDTVDGQGSPGLIKLTKKTDNYLGIFAAFALAGTPIPAPLPDPFAVKAHTDAQVTAKRVDPAGLKLMTLTPDNMPVVELMAVSKLDDGTRPVQYQYKIDDGFWHPWQRSRFFSIKDSWMRVQGRHVVHVKSRIAGEPKTEDETPAEVEVVIDAEPPSVKVTEGEDGTISIAASDLISSDPLVRWRLDAGKWSDWTRASLVAPIPPGVAAEITVEAKDNEGNVGTATQPLVRGRYDGPAAAGCACTTTGDTTNSAPGGLLFVLGISIAGIGARLFGKRRAPGAGSRDRKGPALAKTVARRSLGGIAAIAFASSWAGCHCGTSETHGMTVGSTGTTSGGYSCTGTCQTLQPGLIGEYTSVAVDAKGKIWVSGYSEADWDNGYNYGDLVVGTWDGKKVGWNQVDGVPDMPPVDGTQYNIEGFRGGQTEPGDDVGQWTSIALDSGGNPGVAYYDRTHHALKFAQYDGKKWSTQTVENKAQSEVGRYAKLLFLNNAWVITYQSIEPGGMGGKLISKVRIATSSSPAPAEGGWTFDDAAVSNTSPCRASFCASGEACVKSTMACTKTDAMTSCGMGCASGQACVAGACADIVDMNKIDAYPDAIGGYISVSPDGQGGFGIAYYDRTNGDLYIAQKSGGKWATKLIDGSDAMGNDTGDVGIGATLFIDGNGDWHIAYVNGFTEALQYVNIAKGTTIGTIEVVDDGLAIAGTPNDDGQHLVGDDAHITVLSGGEVHVTYQDATSGTLHYAVGTPGSASHMWTVKALTQTEFAGAFSNIINTNGTIQLVNWWRVGGMSVQGDVRILSP